MFETYSAQWTEDFEGKAVTDKVILSGKGGWVNIKGVGLVYEAVSGHSCLNLGHAHPELIDVAAHTFAKLSYCSPEHQSSESIALSNKLNVLLGGEFKIKYAISGSSANEMALNISRRRWAALGYHHKKLCISLDRGYHGNIGQAKFVTGFEPFKVEDDLNTAGFFHISSSRNSKTGETFSLEELEQQLDAALNMLGQDNIACLFVEPVNFAGGVIIPPKGYLSLLRRFCDHHQITLVVDEVITGFARTGNWFAFQKESIRPDIITLGKGITAGYYPLAAVAVSNNIYNDLIRLNVPLKMVITMAGQPVGCSIALKAIEIIERDQLCSQVSLQSEVINTLLAPVENNPIVMDIRGSGYMWGLEFNDFYPFKATELAEKVASCCERNGCIVAAANGIIRINPPLNMSSDECNKLCATIVKSVDSVYREII